MDSFYSKYLEASQLGVTLNKEDDLMVHFISIDDEKLMTHDEQLFKLLTYTFLIINLLVRNTMRQQAFAREQQLPHD